MKKVKVMAGGKADTERTRIVNALAPYGCAIKVTDIALLPLVYQDLANLIIGFVDDQGLMSTIFIEAAAGKTKPQLRMAKLCNQLEFILLGTTYSQFANTDKKLTRMGVAALMRYADLHADHFLTEPKKAKAKKVDTFVEIHNFLLSYGSPLTLHDVTLLPPSSTLRSLAQAALLGMRTDPNKLWGLLSLCVIDDTSDIVKTQLDVFRELRHIFSGAPRRLYRGADGTSTTRTLPLDAFLELANGCLIKD